MAVTGVGIPVKAPRYVDGVKLGMYEAHVLRPLAMDRPAFIVRFEDGHEAAVFRSELLTTCDCWRQLDVMQAVGF